MIRFDSVSKRYRGANRPALDGVSLEIGAGEFVFLVGASGSGKSSLLRLMLREEKPSTGEIHVLGQRLTSISTRKVPYFRRSLGVVFQDFRLLPNKTVHDNVAFTLQVIGKSRGFIQTTVPDVLETVGLAHKAQNFPNELSGGEQQRVAIARAVVNKPSILLADEPTGNLDPRTSDGIMQVLERINVQGTTVVMATHDVTIVDKMQKRVVELVDGRIIRDELEATYVTSSIKLPKPPRPANDGEQTGPAWARRPGRPTRETPATGAITRPATGGIPRPDAAPRPATGGIQRPDAYPRPATGAVPSPATEAAPAAASTQEPSAPQSGPIWVRSDTGPVLVPGEHAPWRAAPVAPPVAPPDDDGRSLFFAAPVPAQRVPREPTAPTPVVPAQDGEARGLFGRRRGEEPAQQPQPAARGEAVPTGAAPVPARAGTDGDGRAPAPRRAEPLPDHLDFVTGLGLRARRGDDEVGPSS